LRWFSERISHAAWHSTTTNFLFFPISIILFVYFSARAPLACGKAARRNYIFSPEINLLSREEKVGELLAVFIIEITRVLEPRS
jgi:hypothetical protein